MKYQAVYELVQDLSCAYSSDCATIGIGAKACGGVSGYLVYSVNTVDLDELMAAVADLNAYEEGYVIQERIISDCSLARAPVPGCIEHRCVATDL